MASNPYLRGFDLAELQQQLDAWKKALLSLATAASYEISSGGSTRKLTRADLPNANQQVVWLTEAIAELTGQDSGRATYPDFTGVNS